MIKTNSVKAWILAARPKTLTGAAIPVMLGCALAYIYGHFQIIPTILCFLFAFLMQIDANFINDLFDFLKGTDREDRLGPERACAQGWISPKAMKTGIGVTTVLAGITGLSLLFYSGWEMIPVGIACIIFAFLYTAGPYPLAYHGWGDVLVLIFFGFVPVGCTYYVMAHGWNTSVTITSLACGLIIDTLLMVNNFRDREQDAISGKKLEVHEIHCHHKVPKYLGGTDEYQNLVIVSEDVHRLIHATEPHTIQKYLEKLKLDAKQMTKLEKHRSLAKVGNCLKCNAI